MVRIVVPVSKFMGEESVVCDHFGRAPSFAVVDVSDDGKVLSMREEKNFGEHFGGMGKAAELVARLSPDVLIVKGIGPRAISMFESMGVKVASCCALTLKDAINAYFEGVLFSVDACRDARHNCKCER